jgi:hypothetical protein
MESVPKSYRWLFMQAWLLLGAAAVFAVSVQSLALPVVSVLLLAASFYRRQPLPQTAHRLSKAFPLNYCSPWLSCY